MKHPTIQRIQVRKKRQRLRRLRQIHPASISPLKRLWGLRYFVILYLSLFDTTYGLDRTHCNNSLGMESGGIEDEQISASSSYVSTVGPLQSRLNNDNAGGAWCPRPQIKAGSREYLEIDFLETRIVTEIATQGRNDKGRGQEYMEEYTIEYYRPKIGRWVDYHRWDGKKLLNGNSDTKATVHTRLQPAIFATKIRIIPYSVYLRTVCLRIEFYGCHDHNGLLSYTVPPSTDIVGDLNDTTYDGITLNDGTLVDGLGRLADGQVGADSFTLDVGQGRGTGWVAWKNTAFPQKCVELLFEFDGVRNFTEISIYANNFFSKKTQIFGRVVIYFHVEGMLYETEPVVFHPRADLQSEKARNVSVPIPGGALAKLIKIKLYFVQDWLMIGEVYFCSEPIAKELSLENLKLFNEDKSVPEFDQFGNVVPEQGSLTIAYDVYLYIQSALGIFITIAIILGLGYIVFFYLIKKNGPIDQIIQYRRRPFFPHITKEWLARWRARPSDGDPEGGDSSVKLEQIEICMDPEKYPNENPHKPKQALTQLTKGGYVTRIIPDHMNTSNTEIAINYSANQPPLPNQVWSVCPLTSLKDSPHAINNLQLQPQFYNIDPPNQYKYNGKYYTTVQINEVRNDSTSTILVNPYHARPTAPARCVSFSNVDETGGFEEYRNQRRERAISVQGTLGDKIENLFNNRESMSIRDKIQVGPDYLWNIGASDSAPRLCPEADVVHIPKEALTIQKTFSCYLGREISICSTEKLRRIMKGVPELVVIRAAKVNQNQDCVEYFEEVRSLASLSHPGLCNVIGIVTNTIPPMVVQEFSLGEDLCHLLRNTKHIISFPSLIYIVTQICCSMRYLESLFMVHRDLAARNCMIYSNNRVKVTDLAMYSNSYKSDYYHTTSGRRLPLRWMSWESILLGRFTNASAVWSFAITAWEIFGHCSARPYADYSDAQMVGLFERLFYERTLETNCCVFEALPKPTRCPTELYKMLKRCWLRYEEERPSFDEVYHFVVRHFHEELPLDILF